MWPSMCMTGNQSCMILLVCFVCVALHLLRADFILRQAMESIVARVHAYFSMQYDMIGAVHRALRRCACVCDVIHVVPIRNIARDPGYGGVSVGGKLVAHVPSTASLAVSDAIRSHSMFTTTERGFVGPDRAAVVGFEGHG